MGSIEAISIESPENSMPHTIQVGSVLIENRPAMAQALDLQCEPYTANWGVLNALESFGLSRKIHAAGWN
jgi:hypothetical protein